LIRLLLRLFRIKDFEVCRSCETLKQQLDYERDTSKRLTDTLIAIVSPRVIAENPPVEVNPISTTSGMFSRRRAALEERDRQEARVKKDSKHLGKPDDLGSGELKGVTIEQLEKEVGIDSELEEVKKESVQ
jgi:hypothetical protein